MKKIMPVLASLIVLTACTNSATSDKTKDSLNVNSHTSTETNKDTSSYERMPNKINDSMQQ